MIEDREDGIVLREIRGVEDGLRKLVGIAGYEGERKSLGEMDDAVRKGALAHHGRD